MQTHDLSPLEHGEAALPNAAGNPVISREECNIADADPASAYPSASPVSSGGRRGARRRVVGVVASRAVRIQTCSDRVVVLKSNRNKIKLFSRLFVRFSRFRPFSPVFQFHESFPVRAPDSSPETETVRR